MHPNDRRIPDPVSVDISTVIKTSSLINMPEGDGKLAKSEPLPSMALINEEIDKQGAQKDGKHLVNTNLVILGGGTKVVMAPDALLDTLDKKKDAESFLVASNNGNGNAGGNGNGNAGGNTTVAVSRCPQPRLPRQQPFLRHLLCRPRLQLRLRSHSAAAAYGNAVSQSDCHPESHCDCLIRRRRPLQQHPAAKQHPTPTATPLPTPAGSPVVITRPGDLIISSPISASSVQLTAGARLLIGAPITTGSLIFNAGYTSQIIGTITAASMTGTVAGDLLIARPLEVDEITLDITGSLNYSGPLVAPARGGSLFGPPSDGRHFTLFANSFDFSFTGGVAPMTLNGGDADSLSLFAGGSGGVAHVGTDARPIRAESTSTLLFLRRRARTDSVSPTVAMAGRSAWFRTTRFRSAARSKFPSRLQAAPAARAATLFSIVEKPMALRSTFKARRNCSRC